MAPGVANGGPTGPAASILFYPRSATSPREVSRVRGCERGPDKVQSTSAPFPAASFSPGHPGPINSILNSTPPSMSQDRGTGSVDVMRTLPLLLLLALCVGCPTPVDDDDSGPVGDDDDSAAAWVPRDVTLDGPCSMETRAGRFRVERQELFPVIDGSIADGVVPVTILEHLETIGDCDVLRRNNPYCNPSCEPGFTCDYDGECIPFPENKDVGTVTIRGLAELLAMEPVVPGNRYFDTTLTDPLFAPGDAIFLDADGADLPGFLLEGVGSDVLELPDETTIVIEDGQPILVEWPAPTTATDASVRLELSIDQHGNSPVKIECELDDTGSAELPAAIAEALLTAGVSGYPNATLSRGTVDSAPVGDVCVELLVGSPRQPDVRVAGHTPCDDDEDCPDGLTCDIPNNTCI
jgi:hypothetical protein